MSLPFLLEIGTEEIPDWMIERSLAQLRELLEGIFLNEKLTYSEVRLNATPRRLVAQINGLQARQDDIWQETKGPPHAIAFNGDVLTAACLAFLRKQGATSKDLYTKDNYVYCRRLVLGRATQDILSETLPQIILKIHFPKTMYWTGKGGPRFIRPIRWIVALLGDDIVPFELAGVRSGALTSGHRRLGAREVAVTCADYEQRLRDHYVILSAQERHDRIAGQIDSARVKADPDLLRKLSYLTEFPTTITGTFDPEFLSLPGEVLSTVMRHHQNYFSVVDADGNLAPEFVAVMNIDSDSEGFVRRGNERVLRARFNDARFFWETDQKKSLADRKADLAHVTFQAKLGSYLEKVERMMTLAAGLGGDAHAVRAAELCKCDLTTELVKEFTELQGVVGGLYARAQGEPEPVWQAIYDHYKPESMEDSIPRNRTAQIVALADKLDTLRGCFRVGLIPSGSRDPYALRRAGQGVVKILVEGKLEFPLLDLIGDDASLRSFFEERIKHYLKEIRGFAYDEVNACMAAGWSNLVDLDARLERVHRLRASPDFEPLAASFKRIKNILKQAEFSEGRGDIDPALVEAGPERDLHDEFTRIAGQPIENVISRLRPKVDLFFDKVMVNVPDENIRQNRLTLLSTLLAEFSTIADFSEIVTNS